MSNTLGNYVDSKALAEINEFATLEEHVRTGAPLPQAPNPHERVLDEDSYTDAIEHIITRDFFPDHFERTKKKEYQRQFGTPGVSSYKSSKSRKSRKHKHSHPSHSSKTKTKHKHKHKKHKKHNNNNNHSNNVSDSDDDDDDDEDSSSTSSSQDDDDVASEASGPVRYVNGENLSLSEHRNFKNLALNEFQSLYTSEDNKSFSKILRKDELAHFRKFPWIYEQQKLSDKREKIVKMIQYPDHSKDDNSNNSNNSNNNNSIKSITLNKFSNANNSSNSSNSNANDSNLKRMKSIALIAANGEHSDEMDVVSHGSNKNTRDISDMSMQERILSHARRRALQSIHSDGMEKNAKKSSSTSSNTTRGSIENNNGNKLSLVRWDGGHDTGCTDGTGLCKDKNDNADAAAAQGSDARREAREARETALERFKETEMRPIPSGASGSSANSSTAKNANNSNNSENGSKTDEKKSLSERAREMKGVSTNEEEDELHRLKAKYTGELAFWKFKSVNKFMFYPNHFEDPLMRSRKLELLQRHNTEPQVVYENTRFPKDFKLDGKPQNSFENDAKLKQILTDNNLHHSNLSFTSRGTPMIKGYKFVPTPVSNASNGNGNESDDSDNSSDDGSDSSDDESGDDKNLDDLQQQHGPRFRIAKQSREDRLVASLNKKNSEKLRLRQEQMLRNTMTPAQIAAAASVASAAAATPGTSRRSAARGLLRTPGTGSITTPSGHKIDESRIGRINTPLFANTNGSSGGRRSRHNGSSRNYSFGAGARAKTRSVNELSLAARNLMQQRGLNGLNTPLHLRQSLQRSAQERRSKNSSRSSRSGGKSGSMSKSVSSSVSRSVRASRRSVTASEMGTPVGRATPGMTPVTGVKRDSEGFALPRPKKRRKVRR